MARRLPATRDHHTAFLVVKSAINMMYRFVGTYSWQKTRSWTSEWDSWFSSVFKIRLSRDETITIKENQCFGAIFEGFLRLPRLPLKPNNRLKSLHFFSAQHLTWHLRPLPSTLTLAHITGGPSLSLQPLSIFSGCQSTILYIKHPMIYIPRAGFIAFHILCNLSAESVH